jgi:YidC/Oxa1 family membrane protein insertase
MFLSFPSGLVIYWLFNNVISIAQQVYINKQPS